MKVIPLKDRVLVKVEKQTETKTASGIIIPELSQENIKIATVVAVGDDKEKIGAIKQGSRVFYDGYGTKILVDGEELLLLRAENIEAIIE